MFMQFDPSPLEMTLDVVLFTAIISIPMVGAFWLCRLLDKYRTSVRRFTSKVLELVVKLILWAVFVVAPIVALVIFWHQVAPFVFGALAASGLYFLIESAVASGVARGRGK